MDEMKSDDHIDAISKLRGVVNKIYPFTDVDECIDFITDIEEEKVFMIFSGPFELATVAIVHDLSFFLLCNSRIKSSTSNTDVWMILQMCLY